MKKLLGTVLASGFLFVAAWMENPRLNPQRPQLTLASDGNLICPKGTSRQRKEERGKPTTLSEWCARPDGVQEGPRAKWLPSNQKMSETIAHAQAAARLMRVQWQKNGRAHGTFLKYFSDENRGIALGPPITALVGSYQDGLPSGVWREYYPDQEDRLLRTYRFKADRLHGAWEERHHNGRMWVLGQFTDGLLHGERQHFDEQGRLLAVDRLDHGTGPISEWYPNGDIQLQGHLSRGLTHGQWTIWYPSAKRAAQIDYAQGKLLRLQLWEPDGRRVTDTWDAVHASKDTTAAELAAIKRIMKHHREEIAFCSQVERSSSPRMFGEVVVQFTVANGTVTDSVVQRSTLNNRKVESCITHAVHRWRFPPGPKEKRSIVSAPFYIQANFVASEQHRKHGLVLRRDLFGAPRGVILVRYGRIMVPWTVHPLQPLTFPF